MDLEKPLHIVIGSVTDSSVLLSWGTLLTTPFMDSIVEDCVEDGYVFNCVYVHVIELGILA